MSNEKNILRQILTSSSISFETVRQLPFPAFVKDSSGEYIYLSSSLLKENYLGLVNFIRNKDKKISKESVQWMSNDLHLFEKDGFLERKYEIDNKIFKVFKFCFTSGENKYLAGFIIDITDIERDLQERHTLNKIIQNIANPIVVAENKLDYPIVFINEAFTALTGYTFDDVDGKNCRFLQGMDTDSAVKKEITECLRLGKSFNGIIKNYKKNGTPFWNQLSIKPIYDPYNRSITHFLGTQKEIDEQELSDKPFTDIVDDLPTLVIRTDEEGLVEEINDYALKYLGFDSENIVGESLANILNRESKVMFNSKLLSALQLRSSLLNERLVIINGSGEEVKFLVSAKVKNKLFTFVFTEILNLTHPDKFVPPEGGPWYLHWFAAFYNYAFTTKRRSVKVLFLLFVALGPVLSLLGYEEFFAEEYGSLMNRNPISVKPVDESDRLWAYRQLLEPYRYTDENRILIETLLLELRKKYQANRVSIRIYEEDYTAHLLKDMYRPGPGRGPIPKDFWVVNLGEDGYNNLLSSFSRDGFLIRRTSELEPESEIAIAARNLNTAMIISVPDPGNSYFYISLDFEITLPEEDIGDIVSEMKDISRQIAEVLGY